jgi:ElaB/YqjD/DUF883 family membrane-anchored ribosome-binding protein
MSDPSISIGNGLNKGAEALGASLDEKAQRARQTARDAAEAGYAAYDKVRDSAADLYVTARAKADQAAAQAQGYLREQPVVAVGLGVLVGLTLGLMLSGRTTVYVREGHHRPRLGARG